LASRPYAASYIHDDRERGQGLARANVKLIWMIPAAMKRTASTQRGCPSIATIRLGTKAEDQRKT